MNANNNDAIISNFAEVNTFVHALRKSSCPIKIAKKFFPECKGIQTTTQKTRQTASTSPTQPNTCKEISYGQTRKQESCLSGKISMYNQLMDKDIEHCHVLYNDENQYHVVTARQEITHNVCPRSGSIRPIINMIEEKSEMKRKRAFLVMNEVQLPHTNILYNDNAKIGKNQVAYRNKSTRPPSESDTREKVSMLRKFRFDCKERFKAERNERMSMLRIEAARQRYDLHIAERKKEGLTLRLKRFKDTQKQGQHSPSTPNRYKIQMIKAMETGMLLTPPKRITRINN